MIFERDKNLKEFSNYKIGGPADYFFVSKTVEELIEALCVWDDKGMIFILGGGTNVLISDSGFRGLVLKPEFSWIKNEGNKICAGAGALMKDVLNAAVIHGLSGLEWAGGLPGTVGGAVRGNAGAFGGEIKDSVKEVASIKIQSADRRIIKRNRDECDFSYRNSIFKKHDGEEIIVEVIFKLKHGDRDSIKKIIDEKIDFRLTNHPMEYPSIGSIFKNVDMRDISDVVKKQFENVVKQDPFPVIPTACLIIEAGLKGVSIGGAMISQKHPNFIVNVNHATASDVKELIELVKKTIREKFRVILEEEIIYIN